MKKIGLVLFFMLVFVNTAQAVPSIVDFDRVCNLPMDVVGAEHQAYGPVGANGTCISSAVRNSDGLGEDIVCWNVGGTANIVATAWVGGPEHDGEYSLLDYDTMDWGYGSCQDDWSVGFDSPFYIIYDQTHPAGTQPASIVYDAGPGAPGIGPPVCDCSCPIPEVRDGVGGQRSQGLWTATTYMNYALNDRNSVFTTNDADKFWGVRSNILLDAGSPLNPDFILDVHSYNGTGAYVTYGRVGDLWNTGTGVDTFWCGNLDTVTGVGPNSCEGSLNSGNDYVWGLSQSTWATWLGPTPISMGGGTLDTTITAFANKVSGEEVYAAKPVWPSCPAWIQTTVTNGRWPGIQ